MYIRSFLNRFALLVVALLIMATGFSQSKTNIGLNFTGERTSASDFVVGFGGVLERQFSKQHGLETGLYYRGFDLHSQVYVDGSLFGAYTIKEQHVSIPVLYKFYSSILNLSAGPTFDLYTGWKQGKSTILGRIPRFSVDDKFQIGLLVKVSKIIPITKKLFVEPELRYNPIFYQRRVYYGIGVVAKYALTK